MIFMPSSLRGPFDLGGKLQGDHDQWFASIGAHDQQVSAIEPLVEFAESVAPALHLDPAIHAEHRHGHIATEPPAGSAAEWDAFGSQTVLLQQANDGTLGPIALLTRSAAAGHGALRRGPR